MSQKRMNVGIIGAGDFGLVLHRLFEDVADILVADTKKLDISNQTSVKELAERSDVIFLAIPFEAYESVLQQLADHAEESTLVVDISSVKTKPGEMLAALLPQHDYLLLHPLFGPQSAPQKDLTGLSLVVCSDPSPLGDTIVDRFLELGAQRVDMTPKEHDVSMAYTQALTFFLGRGLTDMNIEHTEFATPSFDKLLSLRALDHEHSEYLFQTIQKANPYAKHVREDMIRVLAEINDRLDQE